EIEAFEAPRDAFDNAMERLVDLRATRDQKVLRDALVGLEEACVSSSNIMPAMMAATEAEVSLGEIGAVFRSSFGSWEVPFDF
ncbi:methylmalonyl-CoA mutase, partial [mine drainage metagenome]